MRKVRDYCIGGTGTLPVYLEMTGKMPVPPHLPETCYCIYDKEHLDQVQVNLKVAEDMRG